jgi:tRNA(Ile)-lysidine synthetase-like protein
VPEGRAPLVVRARRAGDRVRLRSGPRRVQDVFVDAGVPRALRELVPVVARGDDVVWIPGVTEAGAGTPGVRLWLVPADPPLR